MTDIAVSKPAAPPTALSLRQLSGRLIGGALLGKLLGFAREIAMAHAFGISVIADSFRSSISAVILPLLPLQNDTVPAVLIPLHKQWQEQHVAAQRFACLGAVILATSLLIMLAVMTLTRMWLHILVGGFTAQALALTQRFVMVMALSMPASATFNLLCAIELSIGRPRLTSIRSSIQNIAVLAGLAIMLATGSIIAIPWCFTLAFNAIAVWGWWALWREGHLDPRGIRLVHFFSVGSEFFRRLRPVLVQPIADIFETALERLLGSKAGTGTIASLDYARALTESAIFLVSTPLGYVVLAKGGGPDHENERRVDAIARPILVLAMPACVFLVLAAPDIITLIYARGLFAAAAVARTSLALQGIAAGLWAATLGWILIRMLNVAGRNHTAAWVFVAAYAVNAAVNLTLTKHLGALGLGLGEAARGITLMLGTAFALGCVGSLLRVVAAAVPVCAVLAAVEWGIMARLAPGLPRLGLEVVACVIAMGAQSLVLLPALSVAFTRRLVGS